MKNRNNMVTGLVCALLVFAQGCAPVDSSNVVESCSGSYDCTGPGGVAGNGLSLHRQGAQCMLGALELRADGTVAGTSLTWTGSASRFDLHASDGVLSCARQDGSGAAGASTASQSCTGSPRACSLGVPGSCGFVQGCYLQSTYDYFTHQWNNSCGGNANPCSNMTSAASCVQQGCTWR